MRGYVSESVLVIGVETTRETIEEFCVKVVSEPADLEEGSSNG